MQENSPSYKAGLRKNDLITHIHTQSVHNLSHPQLMHRLLSYGNEITLQVVPLNSTSIKEGEARKNIGKLLRKKLRKPQHRRSGLEKKSRKSSALLRRFSGKRAAGEIMPGTSSQKQTFMPRSVSSQDGALTVFQGISNSAKPTQYLQENSNLNTNNRLISSNECSKLKHHSSFKGNEPKALKLTTSLKNKRFSDFGISNFLPVSPIEHNFTEPTHLVSIQSPLVASSTLPEIKSSKKSSFNLKNSLIDSELTSRPISLIQSGKSLNKQQRIISEQLLTKNNCTNSCLAVNSTTCQNTRSMPLSPLARQSSSSISSYEPMSNSLFQPVFSSKSSTLTTTTVLTQSKTNFLPSISTSLIKNSKKK